MKTTAKPFKNTGLEETNWGQKLGKSSVSEFRTHIVLSCEQGVGIKNVDLSLFLKGFPELSGYPQP